MGGNVKKLSEISSNYDYCLSYQRELRRFSFCVLFLCASFLFSYHRIVSFLPALSFSFSFQLHPVFVAVSSIWKTLSVAKEKPLHLFCLQFWLISISFINTNTVQRQFHRRKYIQSTFLVFNFNYPKIPRNKRPTRFFNIFTTLFSFRCI